MNWLSKIVSTTMVVTTGCIIALWLTLFYSLATVFGKELDPVTFGSMLAFAASCMGIGYKQFKAKRETAWAEDEETGAAYRPLSATQLVEHKKNRYDVGAFPASTPIREIGSGTRFGKPAEEPNSHFGQPGGIDEPDSVEEHENGRQAVEPVPPPKPKIVEEEWPEEGE